MTPEYLMELADIADPKQLWRRSWNDRQSFTPEERKQLDTGVALRRHATHIVRMQEAFATHRSLLLTPTTSSGNSMAFKMVETPPDHVKLLWGAR